jgi:hypothetical protein
VFGTGVSLGLLPRRLDGHGSEALQTGRTGVEQTGDCLVLSAGDAVTAKEGNGGRGWVFVINGPIRVDGLFLPEHFRKYSLHLHYVFTNIFFRVSSTAG